MRLASIHAQQRCIERFGINPTGADWYAVILAVTDDPPRAVLLSRRSTADRRQEIWLVRLCGKEVAIAWDRDTATIMTVMLPSECSGRETMRTKRHCLRPAFRGAPRSAPHRRAMRLARDIAEGME